MQELLALGEGTTAISSGVRVDGLSEEKKLFFEGMESIVEPHPRTN